MYFGLIFVHFRSPEKILEANALFTHTVTVLKTKSHFSKIEAGISPGKVFLMSKSFMILLMVSIDTRLNENSFLILIFFLIAFMCENQTFG